MSTACFTDYFKNSWEINLGLNNQQFPFRTWELARFVQSCHHKTSPVLSELRPPDGPYTAQLGSWSWLQGPVYDLSLSKADIVNVCCVPIWLFGMGPAELTTDAPGTPVLTAMFYQTWDLLMWSQWGGLLLPPSSFNKHHFHCGCH